VKILALIPARMASSRFPGKPMAKILGKPMIGHVYERVNASNLLHTVAVATCDDEIASYIDSIGGLAVMTSDKHERASDRCAEALLKIESDKGITFDIVVMIQGDEPMTHPNMIAEAVTPMLENAEIKVVNLLGNIKSEEEFHDRNCIKVVCDLSSNALFFSREPIPTVRKEAKITPKKQVCIIPFKRDFLLEYSEMSPTPLELAESVDMLRILEHGHKVFMTPTMYETQSVDTPEDLARVEILLQKIGEH
jgi:3-deoxy-manno-octulosonate cytidylyltransferase (CMP-KDO synthetase)